ncbi:hypothetical protein IWW47_001378 [Coemansia sp. RSA 2052]|nr:hypothetical protein IWW47_001378 [Coemansia sp. RSA 2052]
MHIANTLALRPDATAAAADTKAWPADKDGAAALCPISRATDYIWQLGLQHPASGLVPSSDYDKVLVLHFVGLWTTRVLPLLLLAEPGGLSSADLAMLSKCILARRRSLKQRGPFWNGRSLSIAEVVVAPFADDILHAGLLPDTREFGPLCAWLAAVRASPVDSGRVRISDAELRPELKRRIRSYMHVLATSLLMLWIALSVFYGAMFQRSSLVNSINIHVIDLDGGFVGANVTRMVLDIRATPSTPVWLAKGGMRSLDQAKAWVRLHGWGALVINPGASDRLSRALSSGGEYRAADAMTLVESSGRMVVAGMMFVQPALIAAAGDVCQRFAAQQVAGYKAAQAPALTGLSAVLRPVAYTTVDVAPEAFLLAPVVMAFGFLACLLSAVGVMIMWKLTSFAFFVRVRFRDLLLMWLALLLGLALVVSLYFSLAFLAFRGPGYNDVALTYTPATFFKIWFTGAAVVLALALWLFTWFLNLPPIFVTLPSVFTVVPNVISCISTFELAPTFYRFMYATPFFNGSRIIHYVVSGAYPTLGRNIGVLAGEIVIMSIALAGSVWLRQTLILRGISDLQGWFCGSMYFQSPIPYYKTVCSEATPSSNGEEQARPRSAKKRSHLLSTENTLSVGQDPQDIEISDCAVDNTDLTTGNLGV